MTSVPSTAKPLASGRRGRAELTVLKTFLVVDVRGAGRTIPLLWGWGLTWVDVALAAVFSAFGYHRYFTHGAEPAAARGAGRAGQLVVVTEFFWAGPVRIAFPHPVSWSVHSVCHLIGERPFAGRDKAASFWPLALLSMSESWRNSRHADPARARHGVLRGQVDVTARVIWVSNVSAGPPTSGGPAWSASRRSGSAKPAAAAPRKRTSAAHRRRRDGSPASAPPVPAP